MGPDGKVEKGKTARVAIAHQGIDVWNPSFDVTPHELIDAIITERGEVLRNSKGDFGFETHMPERWLAQVDLSNAAKVVNGGDNAGDEDVQFPMDV